jgi:hypothetical protein
MLNSWTLRFTVLLLLALLLFASSRKPRFTAPAPQEMEEKRREWDTKYADTLGPPAPMHEVRGAQEATELIRHGDASVDLHKLLILRPCA